MHKSDTALTSNHDRKPKPTNIQTRKCHCGNYIELTASGMTSYSNHTGKHSHQKKLIVSVLFNCLVLFKYYKPVTVKQKTCLGCVHMYFVITISN